MMSSKVIILSLWLLSMISIVAASRTRREGSSYWWLGGEPPKKNAVNNPTLGALIGHNRPAESVNTNNLNDAQIAELAGLFGQFVPAAKPCECVPYYQCKDGDTITDGAGIIDIRQSTIINNNTGSTRMDTHSKCANFLDVCCKEPNTSVAPIQGSVDHYTPRCGQINPNGVIARVSGISANQAQFAEFPFMSAILSIELVGSEEVKLYICGGSLISQDVILTAAHCVQSFEKYPERLKVRLGEWDTQRTYEPLKHTDVPVDRVVVHQNFNSSNLQNDYALLFLNTNVTLRPHIDTVCLPSGNEDYDPRFCFVSGWGKDKFGGTGTYQNILKKVSLPVMNDNTCQSRLRTTRLGRHFVLDSSFLCAGGDKAGNDACSGDGGSPLVCRHKTDLSTYFQVGIVAWGIGCGTEGIPGVYADVVRGTPWIREQLKYQYFDIANYKL